MFDMTVKPKHLGHVRSKILGSGVTVKSNALRSSKELSEDFKINLFG